MSGKAICAWKKSFRFTDEEIDKLRQSFDGHARRSKFSKEQIDEFIAGAESAVSDWRSIREMTPSTASEIKTKASDLKSLLEDEELRLHLSATSAGPLDWSEIDKALAPLRLAAQDLYRRTTPKGNRANADTNTIIELLKNQYSASFGDSPGIGNTPFTAFVQALLEITNERFREELKASADRIGGVIKGDNLK